MSTLAPEGQTAPCAECKYRAARQNLKEPDCHASKAQSHFYPLPPPLTPPPCFEGVRGTNWIGPWSPINPPCMHKISILFPPRNAMYYSIKIINTSIKLKCHLRWFQCNLPFPQSNPIELLSIEHDPCKMKAAYLEIWHYRMERPSKLLTPRDTPSLPPSEWHAN